MKEWLRENKKMIVIITIYSICSFIIMLFHEQWRDEAQVWLIVRDLNFLEIIQQMKYEGHFLLWFLVIMPFAKLGLPYEMMKIISWIIVNISAWLIIKKAPFKMWVKILFLCTYPMLYLYPSIARCYCFIPLAITLIAIYYEKRKEQPFKYVLSIVLLANTHVIMLVLVGMLLLTFYIEQIINRRQNTKEENKNIILSFVIVCLLLILSILPLLGSIHTNKDISYTRQGFSSSYLIQVVKDQFITNIGLIIGDDSNFFQCVMIMLAVFLYILYEGRYHTKNFIIIIVSLLYQFIVCGYILGSTSQQKASILMMIVFLFTWIQNSKQEKKEKKDIVVSIALIFLMSINILNGGINIVEEIKENYSSAKETAKYIEQNIEEGSIVITNSMPSCSSIIPYTNKVKYWDWNKGQYFSFVKWDGETVTRVRNINYIKTSLDKEFAKKIKVYLVFGRDYNEISELEIERLDQDNNVRQVFESEPSIMTGEYYKIYEVKRE